MAILAYTVQVLQDGTCLVDGKILATNANTLWSVLHQPPQAAKPSGPVETTEAFLARGGRIARFDGQGHRKLQPSEKASLLSGLGAKFKAGNFVKSEE